MNVIVHESTSGHAAAIESQFPELAPVRSRYLGEGCDSVAFEVNGSWVFRFPKSDDVERQIEIEGRILPALGAYLPARVPQFAFRGAPSAHYPRAFCGYAKLPGDPAILLASDEVALDALVVPIARFLSALHAFPIADAERAGVPRQPLDEMVQEVRQDALADLPRVQAVAPEAPLAGWQRFIGAGVERPGTSREVLLHNDFAAEHVLIDPAGAGITGVIDWSDMAIGDPLVDFAGLFHWGGEALVGAVLASYSGSVDDSQLRCARYLGACRGAMDVAFGLDRNRPEHVRSGLRALQLCTAVTI